MQGQPQQMQMQQVYPQMQPQVGMQGQMQMNPHPQGNMPMPQGQFGQQAQVPMQNANFAQPMQNVNPNDPTFTYRFYICCPCAKNRPASRMLRSFMCWQNFIDIMFTCWYAGLWTNNQWNSDYATFNLIVNYGGLVMFIIGIITSIMARQELKKFDRKEASGTLWLTLTMWINLTGNILGTVFHMLAFFLLAYFGLIGTSQSDEVSNVFGQVLLFLAAIFLVNGLFFIGQLCYFNQFRKAIEHLKTKK